MNKKIILMSLAIISFISVLFTPENANYWIYFLILGIVFGILWFRKQN